EHAIFGASRCVAVTPSDTACALTALEASVVIRRRGGERMMPISDFFVRPATDIQRMTVLRPGEILTEVRVPATWADADFHFEKVAVRQVWEFALLSIAAAFRMQEGRVAGSRLV